MEATNSQGSLLTLQLGDTSSGINIQSITGLDPVKATIVSTSFANQDGAVYQSARRDTRNIVLTLELVPDPTITDVLSLRRNVYDIFTPKDNVSLKFYVDNTDDASEDGYLIGGYIESCESPMFVQDPIVTISVINTDPDFIDPVVKTISTLTTADTTATDMGYLGTVSSGFVATINVNATCSELTMYYTDPQGNTWTLDIAYALLAGDVLTLSTVPGNKYLTLLRAGVTTSILYAVSPQSTWAQLAKGSNSLLFNASGGGSFPVSVSYTARFGAL
jgi:hypothetical protein